MNTRVLLAVFVCVFTSFAQQPVSARRVGIRPTGSYWGALGEQIDIRSGNLNFTLSLLSAKSRGWSVPFVLSYNSQVWQKDGTTITNFGKDVGYGFGWTLTPGSIKPYPASGAVQRYIYTDASGAEYWLDVNSAGIWSSKEGIHVRYDVSANRLYFRDGSFWVMGSTADPIEPDAGSKYPTLLQDTNGNQILVRYKPALNNTNINTSARISQIEDVRATCASGPFGCSSYITYNFNYDDNPFNPPSTTPHLANITNDIGTGEAYDFTFVTPASLQAPFTPYTSFGATKFLNSVVQPSTGRSDSFSYLTGNTGELIRVILPYGAKLEWDYSDFTFAGGRTIREVSARRRSDPAMITYSLTRDPADSGKPYHTSLVIGDPSGAADQLWSFQANASSFDAGLATRQDQRTLPGGAVKARNDFAWAQSPNGNPYIASVLNTLDVGAAFQKQSKVEQIIDDAGNLTQTKQYDFGNLATPARTYNQTYLTSSAYTNRHIRDRLLTSSVTGGGSTISLVTRTYDDYGTTAGCPSRGGLVSRTGAREHDDSNYGASFTTRGNVSIIQQPSRTTCVTHDMLGNVTKSSDKNGHYTDLNITSGTNYAVPSAITPNGNSGLQTTLTHNAFLGVTNSAGPNGANASFGYDASGRPGSAVSPLGASTAFAYQDSSLKRTSTTNGHTARTTLDGYGRVIKEERLDTGGVVKSVVDTEYTSCACSPIGKVRRVSMPHAPGGTVYWATRTYDALGRTVSVSQPNNSGTTTYTYEGNNTKETNPSSKWRQSTTDVFGNVTKMTEANPAGGTMDTNYTYSLVNQLRTVTMTRGSTTQTRTFAYDPATQRLASVSTPESGTTSYVYNPDGTLLRKTDAKGQKTEYTYDTLGRATIEKRFAAGSGVDDPCQRVTYTYDNSNPVDNTFTVQNSMGRVSTVQYGGSTCAQKGYGELYSYNAAGLMTKKRLRHTRGALAANLDGTWAYDNEGRSTTITYPAAWQLANPAAAVDGGTFTHAYDTSGRPSGMTEARSARTVAHVSGVAYNAGDQITAMTFVNQIGAASDTFFNETRQYNPSMQLTRLTVPGVADHEYRFSATQNDGRILSRKEYISGEDVSYGYDSLKRLISASTTHTSGTAPQWGQSFTYDGFGNLTAETVTKGSAPSGPIPVNAANNRLSNFTYDANGNQTSMPQGAGTATLGYDVANRLVSSSVGEQYAYAPGNKRVWRKKGSGIEEVYFYGPNGTRLGAYQVNVNGSTLKFLEIGKNVSFGGQMIRAEGASFAADRQGSSMSSSNRYFPYGGEQTVTSDDRTKFGTYHRDSTTGHDYADQRYYTSQYGRFMSADPLLGDVTRPQSWNRYSYAGSDPANQSDPSGLCYINTVFYPDGAYPCPAVTSMTVSATGTPVVPSGLSDFLADASRYYPQDVLRLADVVFTAPYANALTNYNSSLIVAQSSTYQPLASPDTPISPSGQQVLSSVYNSTASLTTATPYLMFGGGAAAIGATAAAVGAVGSSALTTLGLNFSATLPPIVTFGHGARHLVGTGLSQQAVEDSIIQRVTSIVQSGQTISGWYQEVINVNGVSILYSGYPLANGAINVGTYYPFP